MSAPDLKSIFCKAEAILKGKEEVRVNLFDNPMKARWTSGDYLTLGIDIVESEKSGKDEYSDYYVEEIQQPVFCAIGALGAAIAILENPFVVISEGMLEEMASSKLVQAASREFLLSLPKGEQKKVINAFGYQLVSPYTLRYVNGSRIAPSIKTMEEFLKKHAERAAKDNTVNALSEIVIEYNDNIAEDGNRVIKTFSKACVKLTESAAFLETGGCS